MSTYKDPDYKKKWAKTPRAKYAQHKAQAKARGVQFSLSFEDWWSLWEPHWLERGRSAAQYCMSRHDDTGGYVVGNVEVKQVSSNISEQLVSGAHVTRKLTAKAVAQIKSMVNVVPDAKIAKMFGVSQPHITRILTVCVTST